MYDAIAQWFAAEFTPDFWVKLLQIVWVDIILAGDNAVVIAMACRALPDKTRKWGIILGALVAIVLRVIFAGVITTLLAIWGLKVAGGLALIYIAVELLLPQKHDGDSQVAASDTLFRAIRTIAIADLVMSLDNVIAIAGVAQGDIVLLALGLIISIPLVIGGATIITALLDRFPILVMAGAGLLGWIAGHMIVTDAAVIAWIGPEMSSMIDIPASIVGVIVVLAIGSYLKRRHRAAETVSAPAEAVREAQQTVLSETTDIKK
jgi:YjbE family integral membrane protein